MKRVTDVTGEKLAEYVGGYLGELVGGALTPGRVVRDVVAAFDKEEARLRDFNKLKVWCNERGLSAFKNTIASNLPFDSKFGGFDDVEIPTREESATRDI